MSVRHILLLYLNECTYRQTFPSSGRDTTYLAVLPLRSMLQLLMFIVVAMVTEQRFHGKVSNLPWIGFDSEDTET